VRARLELNVDFIHHPTGILYSVNGAQKMAAVLTSAGHRIPELELLFAAAPAPAPVKRFIVRRRCRNNHTLQCHVPDDPAKIVMVRVRDDTNFVPGMEVTAEPYGHHTNVYQFVGAYPRARGRY